MMLQRIRDRSKGWFAIAIFSILLISMGLLGVRTYLNATSVNQFVAKVNGVSITRDVFEQALQRLKQQMQVNSKIVNMSITPEIRSSVLEALIGEQVLNQAAINQGYRVSSLQIGMIIRKMPQFELNGIFSPERFEQLTAHANFSPIGFFDEVGMSFIVNQPKRGFFSTSFVVPSEADEIFKLSNQKRQFSWIVIDSNNAHIPTSKILNYTPEQVENYYKMHIQDFKVPEQVSVEYLLLSSKNSSNNNKNASGSEDNWLQMREKLADLSYSHPESLAFVAKEMGLKIKSTGLFTRKTGSTDIVSQSEKVRNLAFSSDVLISGNNSDVVDMDSSNSVVVRLKEHFPSRVLPLSDVRSDIVNTLVELEKDKNLKALSDQIAKKLQASNSSADDVINHYHLVWHHSGNVGRNDTKIVPASILAAAFRLPSPKAHANSVGVTAFNKGYAVVSLSDVTGPVASQSSIEYQRLSEDLSVSFADSEYSMYKDSLIERAKISIQANDKEN